MRCVGALLLVLWSSSAVSSPVRILTLDGLDPVKIGMTRNQAEAAIGVRLKEAEGSGVENCEVLNRRDGRDSFIWYMVESGKITRIAVDHSGIRTPEGIAVGSSEEKIKRVYPIDVAVIPNTYDDQGHDVTIGEKKHHRGYVFETHNGVVVALRSGVFPSVTYVENCL